MLKTSRPPERIAPGWAAPEARLLDRCVRRSYRLTLVAPGQPCLLWLSGPDRPGVHALGEIADGVEERADGPVVHVRLALLPQPVPRAELLADARMRDAEVLRMPAGSNPSWLSATQFAAVLDRTGRERLGRWVP
ncbi:hypothetical protein [Blastococcus litoris]|uniref:hypothetical protein n=1 Tax=Blastococcus litoris TaxID=2171622 RepID=UPI001F146E14|nr:hypothetical protein [Blastococcus litoris]